MSEAFEGWAIVELMGHRRLAGRLSEVTIGGSSFLRLDIPGPSDPDPDCITPFRASPSGGRMTWATGPWLGFDTETNGRDPLTARLVSACVAYRSESDSGWTREWLADAGGEDISQECVDIHGITSERAHAEGEPVVDVAEEVRELLAKAWASDVPVVAFNAAYDLTLLNAELLRAGRPELSIDGPVLDPLVIDRMASRRRGKRRLPDVCAHYSVAHTAAGPGEDPAQFAGAHDAVADVLATLRVLWRMGKVYPELAALTARDLHDRQIEGHAQWAESFEAYLRSVGKGDVIDRAWPIRRVPVEVA